MQPNLITHRALTLAPVPASSIRQAKIVWLGGKTMGQWRKGQANPPDYLLNGSLWDKKGAIGTIIREGEQIRSEGNGLGFGLTDEGRGWAFGGPWDRPWRDYITGTPALIWQGKATGGHMPLAADERAKTRRSALCAAGNTLYLATGKGLTLAEFTAQLLEYGMYYAINLDGGGSSRLMIGDRAVNAPTDDRRCPNAIAIWLKKNEKQEETPMKSIYLSPSTQQNNQGAGDYGTEEQRMNQLCDLVEKKLKNRYKLYRNRPEMTLQQVVADSNGKKPDIHLALHSNAGGGQGCECLICAKGGQAEKLANQLYRNITAISPFAGRGVKTSKTLYEVNKTTAPAVILEAEFHDNEKGAAWIVEQMEPIAQAIAQGVTEYFGDSPAQSEPDPEALTTQQAIEQLAQAGIIDTPEYWQNAVQCVKHLDGLLMKMAGALQK